MEIAFFDVDEITHKYVEGKKVCDCNITLLAESIENVSGADYEKVKDISVAAIFVHTAMIGESVLSKFPSLKLLAARSTGFDQIDLEYCKSRGIAVVNVPGYGSSTVAEYAFGLMLNLTRKIMPARRELREGRAELSRYMGFDLEGRTLGIVGAGSIGRHAARIARGFGMKVLAYDLYPSDKSFLDYVTLEEIYKSADIISLHAPSTKENYHMINAAAIEKMKDGVIIINTARGDLVDAEALYKYLKSGKIGGAGLDVLEDEDFVIHDDIFLAKEGSVTRELAVQTVINSKLLMLENVIVTPHAAFNSVDAVHRILDVTFDNIKAFSEGKVQNSVIK